MLPITPPWVGPMVRTCRAALKFVGLASTLKPTGSLSVLRIDLQLTFLRERIIKIQVLRIMVVCLKTRNLELRNCKRSKFSFIAVLYILNGALLRKTSTKGQR